MQSNNLLFWLAVSSSPQLPFYPLHLPTTCSSLQLPASQISNLLLLPAYTHPLLYITVQDQIWAPSAVQQLQPQLIELHVHLSLLLLVISYYYKSGALLSFLALIRLNCMGNVNTTVI